MACTVTILSSYVDGNGFSEIIGSSGLVKKKESVLPQQVMKTQKGSKECWTSILTLTFGTTWTAELSAALYPQGNTVVESSWNVMAHDGKWRGNWRMVWVARTLHATSEYGVSSIRARLKRDGTRAETRFGLSDKWTSPFKSAGESVQSTTGSRGVRISGQRLYYI